MRTTYGGALRGKEIITKGVIEFNTPDEVIDFIKKNINEELIAVLTAGSFIKFQDKLIFSLPRTVDCIEEHDPVLTFIHIYSSVDEKIKFTLKYDINMDKWNWAEDRLRVVRNNPIINRKNAEEGYKWEL